jgi:hypothetical protein
VIRALDRNQAYSQEPNRSTRQIGWYTTITSVKTAVKENYGRESRGSWHQDKHVGGKTTPSLHGVCASLVAYQQVTMSFSAAVLLPRGVSRVYMFIPSSVIARKLAP